MHVLGRVEFGVEPDPPDVVAGFFRHLAKGRGKTPNAAALREAQIELIDALKKDGHTHPFFWAAFTLSGR